MRLTSIRSTNTLVLLLALLFAKAGTGQMARPRESMVYNWAGLGHYKAANEALTPDPARVVFMGDSITDFWVGHGGKFFPGKPYVNRGISGHTTAQMLERFRQDVVDLHPAAVVILAGINDIIRNVGPFNPEPTEDNLRAMTGLAKANGIRVILASVLPLAEYPRNPASEPAPKVIALNKWLIQFCAEQHITYLDYYSAMVGANGGMKPGVSLDGLHPNAAGYAIMEPLAQAAIDQAAIDQPSKK